VTVAGVGAAGLLAACGSSSSAKSSTAVTTAAATATSATPTLTKFSVQLSWVADSEFSQLFLADSNGNYAKENVAVKLIPGGADVGAIEGLVAGGKADIGIATDITSTVAAIADGNPLVVIGTLYQSNLQVLMSKPSKPYRTMKEMVGKRIGGSQGSQPKFDAMFRIAGLKPDYKFIPTGYGPSTLINGDCDVQAGFVTDEVLSFKAETGSLPVMLSYEAAGLPAYTLPIFTTTATLSKKREALMGFLKATIAGAQADAADPTAGAKLAAEKYGKSANLTLADELKKNAAYVPYQSSSFTQAHGYLWVDPAHLSGPIYQGMTAAGLKTAPIGTVLDSSLLADVAKAG
jgi:ABC-type nitrate/sulfonate/bicarbonate transport system substrate-binding protein